MAVGVDIVEISRIEMLTNKRAFIQKYFSKDEQSMFATKRFATQTIAANYAGKEAFSKAIGTGIKGFKLSEIEILRTPENAPYINLTGNAKEIAEKLSVGEISISLSHDAGIAIAMVQVEKK